MTSEQPKVLLTGRYTVKQTCEALGICRETLRKHTEQGYISAKHRVTNLRPYYTGKAILAYWNASMA